MNLTAITIFCAAMLVAAAAADQVRVTVRVIEVPHAAMTKWLSDPGVKGWKVHDEAVKLAPAGGAEIVETIMVVGKSGEILELGSFGEVIHPTGVWISNLKGPPTLPSAPEPLTIHDARRSNYVSFDTRNTGVSLEIVPHVDMSENRVALKISLDFTERTGTETYGEIQDQWGDASARMPVFDSKRMTNSIALADGVFELWNIFTPKPAAIPAPATRMLVFVRADVLPIPIDP